MPVFRPISLRDFRSCPS